MSLVTAFEQPDVASSEVRIVVKRASGLKPEIRRKGSLLLVDFPRTGDAAEQPFPVDHREQLVVVAVDVPVHQLGHRHGSGDRKRTTIRPVRRKNSRSTNHKHN